MKNFKIITLSIILSTLLFTSCEKEEDVLLEDVNYTEKTKENDNAITEVTHNYTYNDEKFTIVYTFNTEEDEVLNVEGDVEMAEEVFANDNSEQALYFPIQDEDSNNDIDIVVFDSYEELQDYQNEEGRMQATYPNTNNKSFCFDHTIPGESDVRFYNDISLRNEMIFLRQNNISFRQDFDLGGNDNRLSSFEVDKGFGRTTSVYLFERGCFRGRNWTFDFGTNIAHAAIFDLRSYTLSGWWFWRTSWNDQASSFRVWER